MAASIPQALFLDRDGTLIEWVDFLYDPKQVKLVHGVAKALRIAKAANCLLFVHTNQSGVGRGYFRMEDVEAVNRRITEMIGLGEALFDGVCVAPDHPERLIPGTYRKPSPRFELETIDRHRLEPNACYIVGDSLSDVDTGAAAGIRSALVRSARPPELGTRPGALVFPALLDFIEAIFRQSDEPPPQ